uniref:Uncharacterized protein n=1 Tax=Cucumis melo TaxID=3656 RepID=A0A9I9EK05_CUCME
MALILLSIIVFYGFLESQCYAYYFLVLEPSIIRELRNITKWTQGPQKLSSNDSGLYNMDMDNNETKIGP